MLPAREWAQELDHIMQMEDLTAKQNYGYDLFADLWLPCILLKEGSHFPEMLACLN